MILESSLTVFGSPDFSENIKSILLIGSLFMIILQRFFYFSAKEASDIFHNIMQASVKGNPKPAPKKKAAKKKG